MKMKRFDLPWFCMFDATNSLEMIDMGILTDVTNSFFYSVVVVERLN